MQNMALAADKLKDKMSVAMAESLIKSIRSAAAGGRKTFRSVLTEPLLYAGWKADYSAEPSLKQLNRIEENAAQHPGTVAPRCKRMIAAALTESESATGNCSIFFLEMAMRFLEVATARETIEFGEILLPAFSEFEEKRLSRSASRFEQALENSTENEIIAALETKVGGEDVVVLGKHKTLIEFRQEAKILFEKIRQANRRNDMVMCRKLIAGYMIRYAEYEDNNREEVEKLISALDERQPGFRKELQDFMAIELYYGITGGIATGDLKKTVWSIRKYAFIFEGSVNAVYAKEIDTLEKKLYTMIRKKGLMKELIRSGQPV